MRSKGGEEERLAAQDVNARCGRSVKTDSADRAPGRRGLRRRKRTQAAEVERLAFLHAVGNRSDLVPARARARTNARKHAHRHVNPDARPLRRSRASGASLWHDSLKLVHL